MKKRIEFSKIDLEFFLKNLQKAANLMQNATELLRFLKTFKIYVFLKKHRLVFRKNSWFFKNAKSIKFALQGHWKFRNSQNVQKLALWNEIYVFFGKKLWFFWIMAQGSNFTVKCNRISKISQNVRNLVSSWKNKMVSRIKSWVFWESLTAANLM